MTNNNEKIVVAKFGKAYGIKGWLWVYSFTDPKEQLLNYAPWYIKQHNQWLEIIPKETKLQNDEIVVKLPEVNQREIAQKYTNLEIAIAKVQLPQLPVGEYYWSDLIGLKVIDQHGEELGIVDHMLATGANDVLVLKNGKERMLPYIDDVVLEVDIKNRMIRVEWEEEE